MTFDEKGCGCVRAEGAVTSAGMEFTWEDTRISQRPLRQGQSAIFHTTGCTRSEPAGGQSMVGVDASETDNETVDFK